MRGLWLRRLGDDRMREFGVGRVIKDEKRMRKDQDAKMRVRGLGLRGLRLRE
jgi:hypothetical protein